MCLKHKRNQHCQESTKAKKKDDEETEDWIKAVKDNGLTWVQLWNGDEDLENSPAMDYVISAIPATFLIDADGTIIGRNLRDNELDKALEDYFSTK